MTNFRVTCRIFYSSNEDDYVDVTITTQELARAIEAAMAEIDYTHFKIEFLRIEDATKPEKKRFYYTFGNDIRFPYGVNDFIEVHATDMNEANAKFKERYPNRPGSKRMNCAGRYTQEQWEKVGKRYYGDRQPIVIIE